MPAGPTEFRTLSFQSAAVPVLKTYSINRQEPEGREVEVGILKADRIDYKDSFSYPWKTQRIDY